MNNKILKRVAIPYPVHYDTSMQPEEMHHVNHALTRG